MTLSFDTLPHLWLDIDPEIQRECWRQSQELATPTGRWNAYLNQLCLNTFLAWCSEEHSQDAVSVAEPSLTSELWEIVNGQAITLGRSRLILMPSDAIDLQELRVPQEWVDIPAWSGDYYLAVQINPDERWMRVWGYTTHQTLKSAGQFEEGDRTYTLEGDALIPDLNVLWVVQQLNRAEVTRSQLSSLPFLRPEQADSLLDQVDYLSGTALSVAHLRLSLPSEQWQALLAAPQWRSRLLSRLTAQRVQSELSSMVQMPSLAADLVTHLRDWFQNSFQAGWQSLEEMLGVDVSLVYEFRREVTAGEIRRVKLLTLESSTGGHSVALMLSLSQEEDGRVEVRAQLRPAPGMTHLPANLMFELLTQADQPLQTVRSRSQDNYIQLKRFKCLPGWQFILKIELDGFEIREGFVS